MLAYPLKKIVRMILIVVFEWYRYLNREMSIHTFRIMAYMMVWQRTIVLSDKTSCYVSLRYRHIP